MSSTFNTFVYWRFFIFFQFSDYLFESHAINSKENIMIQKAMKTVIIHFVIWIVLYHPAFSQSIIAHRHFPEGEANAAQQYVLNQSPSGKLWTGNENGHLFQYENEQWQSVPIPNAADSSITAIHFDQAQRMWIATAGDGVYLNLDAFWKRIDVTEDHIQSNYVNAISENEQGHICLAHGTAGLSISDGSNWSTYSAENAPLPVGEIKDISFDHQGNLWIAVASFLVKKTGDEWIWYDLPEWIGASNLVMNDLKYFNNKLLISTNFGLFQLASGQSIQWLSEELGFIPVNHVTMDETKQIWASWPGYGIFHSKEGMLQAYEGNAINQIPSYSSDMLSIGDQLWLGNAEGGITEIQIMPTSVKTEGRELKDFDVFPNPTSDYIQLKHIACQTGQAFQVDLLNTQGIRLGTWSNTCELNLSSFPNGIYSIRVRIMDSSEEWISVVVICH